ncbi:MAG TPA: alpha-galactosidase [Anaerolineae bacterium]|nr:alpha-galactosidase [Anaerolineae bacterium]
MHIIQNNYYQVYFDPEIRRFGVISADDNLPLLRNAWIAVHYRDEFGHKCEFVGEWSGHEIQVFNKVVPNHGKGKQAKIIISSKGSKLDCQLIFFLPENYPFVLWKVVIHNNNHDPLWIRRIDLLRSDLSNEKSIVFKGNSLSTELTFFSHGWQSWSYTAAYCSSQRQRRSHLGFLQNPMVVNPGTPLTKQRGHFSSDFFGVVGDQQSRTALLVGFLSQKQHFGSVEAWLRDPPFLYLWANGDDTRLNPDKSIETDWAVVYAFHAEDSESLAPYLEAVAREHHIEEVKDPLQGWCSWYYYYQNINKQVITENLEAASLISAELPLKLIQIDDGFQEQVGDWFEFRAGFPKGVVSLAEKIKAAGFTPGLWLAPFIINRRSRLYHEHPDWVLRNRHGKPVNAGFVWNSFGAALDLTNQDALGYASRVVSTAVHEWGFPYLKLDFLYAGALKGRYQDDTRTRAQVLYSGVQALRRAVGNETTLVGCGAPLGSVLGLVDAMRIGADVSGAWRPKYFGISFPFNSEPSIPSACNSIQNILTRAPLHRRWWINDPDCLLIRSSTELTISEVQSLATAIALTGGSLLLSDDLKELTKERLRLAAALIPLIGKRARVLDWISAGTPQRLRLDIENAVGHWHLLACFNWENQPITFSISPEEFNIKADDYWVSDFWNKTAYIVNAHRPFFHGEVPSHGVKLLAVRRVHENQPQYIGGDLHISQGLEICDWIVGKKEIQATIDTERNTKGLIFIAHPQSISQISLDGNSLLWQRYGHDIYEIPVVIHKKSYMQIRLK